LRVINGYLLKKLCIVKEDQLFIKTRKMVHKCVLCKQVGYNRIKSFEWRQMLKDRGVGLKNDDRLCEKCATEVEESASQRKSTVETLEARNIELQLRLDEALSENVDMRALYDFGTNSTPLSSGDNSSVKSH